MRHTPSPRDSTVMVRLATVRRLFPRSIGWRARRSARAAIARVAVPLAICACAAALCAVPVHASSPASVTVAAPLAATLSGHGDPSPAAVDLSQEGTSDWVHWGRLDAYSVDRKSGGDQIGRLGIIGTGPVAQDTTSPTRYSWTGGAPTTSISDTATSTPTVSISNTTGSTPTTSISDTATGVSVTGVGNGFRLHVPARAGVSILRVYVGVSGGRGLLTATLGHGARPAYSDRPFLYTRGASNVVYTLTYRSASITVDWTLLRDNGNGSVTVQAATLRTVAGV